MRIFRRGVACDTRESSIGDVNTEGPAGGLCEQSPYDGLIAEISEARDFLGMKTIKLNKFRCLLS